MLKFEIVKTKHQIEEISKLARVIQERHFIPIVGTLQVDYMLKKFQSEDAIKSQIDNGYKYVGVYKNSELTGYFAINIEDNSLYLSKFYLLEKHRGLGIGRKMMGQIILYAGNLKSIYLNVNKINGETINIYKKLGFEITETVVQDIGDGFVMDDYIMVKKLAKI